MKLISFCVSNIPRYGLLREGGVVDLTRHFLQYPSLKSFLAAMDNIPAEMLSHMAIAMPSMRSNFCR